MSRAESPRQPGPRGRVAPVDGSPAISKKATVPAERRKSAGPGRAQEKRTLTVNYGCCTSGDMKKRQPTGSKGKRTPTSVRMSPLTREQVASLQKHLLNCTAAYAIGYAVNEAALRLIELEPGKVKQ
jgi:hypothetical protein